MAGYDGHERGLGDYSAERAAESEEALQNGGGREENDEGSGHVSQRQAGEGGDVQSDAQFFTQLRGDQAAYDGAGGPARFEIAQAARSGVKNVAGQRDEDYVGADHSGHQ